MKPKALFTGLVLATIGLSPLVRAQEHEHHHATMEKAGSFASPESIREEHAELHQHLGQLTKLPGKTGEAARAVADALHPHFVKEEEYALPALGLLPALSRGDLTPEMRNVLPKTDRLKAELPQMLAEHKAIGAALDRLAEAAKAEGRKEAADFAQELRHHARTEEEILYPAAIVVGEYVRLKLEK